MDRLLKMDKEQFASRKQADIRRILEQVAEAVNNAPQGNLISGSEVQVRDLMAELRQRAFQTAVQMWIDATEASSSPKDAQGKARQSKGRASRSTLSLNGRIDLHRIRWYAAGQGSDCPPDLLVDATEATVSVGTRQLCCRLGIAGRSLALSVGNLKEAAQIEMGEELFRTAVESEGKTVVNVSASEQLEIDWSAAQCKAATSVARGPWGPAPSTGSASRTRDRRHSGCR